MAVRIGAISDTHGLMRPEALAALRDVAFILHAGDIGAPGVLDDLRKIAPVVAVRGNNDKGEWAKVLQETEVFEVGAVSMYLLHDLKQLDLEPHAAGFRVVVSGHSHRPSIEERNDIVFLNPGSAGPRRFQLPVTLAEINIADGQVNARLIHLL